MVVRSYLKSTNIIVEEAENGVIALDKMKAENYDLVLMDIQMPMMDGYDAMRLMRQWEQERGLARTRIVALTASALASDVKSCLEAGADLYLSKPIKKHMLLAALSAPRTDSAAAAA